MIQKLSRIRSALRLLVATLPLGLTACAGGSFLASPQDRASGIAQGFEKLTIQTPQFDLLGYLKLSAPQESRLVVFIEGDGVAYVNRNQRAFDPTPEDPVALRLAAADARPNRLYLARPCQYTGGRNARGCSSDYWTTHRYAPETVAALDTAITQIRQRHRLQVIDLVGYSGGGGMALLLAARRSDVASVVTLAGVLDHAAWTGHFGDTPLWGSLNAVSSAERLRRIPQYHFVGGRDDQVPPHLAAAFMRRLNLDPAGRVEVIPAYTHQCCWARDWTALAARPLRPAD